MSSLVLIGRAVEFGIIASAIRMVLLAGNFCNRNCTNVAHHRRLPVYPCMHLRAKFHMNEEKLILEIVKKELEP